MNKEKLNEVSFDELANDKNSEFFFHGGTHEKIKKIEKPSLNRPFFVTNKISVAKEYALEKIYILRLNETNYFDFRKKSDWMKLCNNPYLAKIFQKSAIYEGSLMDFSVTVGYCLQDIKENKKLMKKIKNQKTFNEYLKILSSEKLLKVLNESSEIKDLQNIIGNEKELGIVSFAFWLLQFCKEDFIKGKLILTDSVKTRRNIKGVLFKCISEKTDYKIVGESNTLNDSHSIVEFAILDISAIKDIYPYPVKIKDASKILKQLKDSRK